MIDACCQDEPTKVSPDDPYLMARYWNYRRSDKDWKDRRWRWRTKW